MCDAPHNHLGDVLWRWTGSRPRRREIVRVRALSKSEFLRHPGLFALDDRTGKRRSDIGTCREPVHHLDGAAVIAYGGRLLMSQRAGSSSQDVCTATRSGQRVCSEATESSTAALCGMPFIRPPRQRAAEKAPYALYLAVGLAVWRTGQTQQQRAKHRGRW